MALSISRAIILAQRLRAFSCARRRLPLFGLIGLTASRSALAAFVSAALASASALAAELTLAAAALSLSFSAAAFSGAAF